MDLRKRKAAFRDLRVERRGEVLLARAFGAPGRPDGFHVGTHGGQVRLPFVGALITRTAIGRRYDRGLFTWPGAANGAEPTLLYVNAGVGTSILPVRFFDPPT